jgi:DNA mismatch repair protein MutL
MEMLLREWSICEFKDVCPHDRPIMKRLALVDLLREFGRL